MSVASESVGHKMKEYKIPCAWQMYGYLHIKANNFQDAIDFAESDECELPENGSYVMGSFEVDHDVIEDNEV